MTYVEAKKFLKRAEKNGYVRAYGGIVNYEDGKYYGINIDGDGRDGRYFGCPQIIWDAAWAEQKFPTRKYKKKSI